MLDDEQRRPSEISSSYLERDQKGANLCLGRLACHHFFHCIACFLRAEGSLFGHHRLYPNPDCSRHCMKGFIFSAVTHEPVITFGHFTHSVEGESWMSTEFLGLFWHFYLQIAWVIGLCGPTWIWILILHVHSRPSSSSVERKALTAGRVVEGAPRHSRTRSSVPYDGCRQAGCAGYGH